MDLSIILVNYNTFELTANALKSIYQTPIACRFEVIVVDNNSSQGNPNDFKIAFPGINLICNGENAGFAKGNNTGIAHAKGKYIVLLNTDTIVSNDVFTPCIRYFETHPDTGALTISLRYPDGTVQNNYHRLPSVTGFFKKTRVTFENGVGDADWIWGAFFFTSKAVLNKFPSGKLHDYLFMYEEDVLWGYYIREKLGLQVKVLTSLDILHIHKGSNAMKYPAYKTNILKNRKRWMIKERGVIYAYAYLLLDFFTTLAAYFKLDHDKRFMLGVKFKNLFQRA
jgi:GT2 family glycosyltransferase